MGGVGGCRSGYGDVGDIYQSICVRDGSALSSP